MATQEPFLFETAGETAAFLMGIRYVNLPGLTAKQDEGNPLKAIVTLVEDDEELEAPEELWQDLAAYLPAFGAAGFQVKELDVGHDRWARWEQELTDGRVIVVSCADGIRLPGYDEATEVRIYRDRTLDDRGLELVRFSDPKAALLQVCADFDLPAPSAEELDQEYESPI